MPEKLNGKNFSWTKQDLIGKGDAGEVYQVTSRDFPELAVLKCPSRIATGGTIIRQASQIEQEAQILKQLAGEIYSDKGIRVIAPKLIDESLTDLSLTGAYFMVSEQAKGISLKEMIRDHQQGSKSVTRRFILKVISALFKFYREIHSKRIVWNDFKPEHLFWDESQLTLMVIDWANGRMLSENESDTITYPVYLDDLKQMINEVGLILQTIAPDLIDDLGWPFEMERSFGEERVKTLQTRAEFMESYLNYRVIENRAIEAITAEKMKELADLELLITSQRELAKMGEFVDKNKLSTHAQELLISKIESEDFEAGNRVLFLINDFIPETEVEKWFILYRLLGMREIIPHSKLIELIRLAIKASWIDLFWQLKSQELLGDNNIKLKHLMALTRKCILPKSCHFHNLLSWLGFLKDEINVALIRARYQNETAINEADLKDLYQKVEGLLSDLGSLVTLREWEETIPVLEAVIMDAKQLNSPFFSCIIEWINAMKRILREITVAWRTANLIQVRELTHQWLVWCPEADLLLEMDASISQLEQWLDKMMAGPYASQPPLAFISELLETRPAVERFFDLPRWMNDLLVGLEEIKNAENADEIESKNQQYNLPMNWISQIGDSLVEIGGQEEQKPLTDSQKTILTHFYDDLKSGVAAESALEDIHINLRWAFPAYQQLSQAFENIFLPLGEDEKLNYAIKLPVEDQPNYQMAQQLLLWVRHWQESMSQGKLNFKEPLLDEFLAWAIIRECLSAQKCWQEEIIPYLNSLMQSDWQSSKPEFEISSPATNLSHCITALASAEMVWQEICLKGIDMRHLELLKTHLDEARMSFLQFINQEDPSKPYQFIFSKFQADISEQYQRIVRMRSLANGIYDAYLVLSNPEMSTTAFGSANAESLIMLMVSLNESMPQREAANQTSLWKAEYEKVIQCKYKYEFQQILADLDVKNPLFGWFQAKWQGFTD